MAETTGQLRERLVSGLKAAHDQFLVWNAQTWMRPVHLLGLLCIEERRQEFAVSLLKELGYERQVGAALRMASAVGGGPRQRAQDEAQAGAALIQAVFNGMDAIDMRLNDEFLKHKQSGAFLKMLKLHGICDAAGKIKAAFLNELLTLASLPRGDTETDPVLSMQNTPQVYRKFIGMLFVGFAHNLPVEAYVSRVATVSKAHAGVKPACLSAMFMYKVRLERQRCERREAGTRCALVRPGSRRMLRDGPLRCDASNRVQLQLMVSQAHRQAQRLQERRKEYFAKGEGCLGRRVRQVRRDANARTTLVNKRVVDELTQTKDYGPKGGRRWRAYTPAECLFFLPSEADLAKNRRKNLYTRTSASSERGGRR